MKSTLSEEIAELEWVPDIPDDWSLEEIVAKNVNLAIKLLAAEMRLSTETCGEPGKLEIVWDDVVLDCGHLRDAFKVDLMDWGELPQESDSALAWADYLESLASDIRAAAQQAQDNHRKG